jgi:hypothetical protein
MGKFLIGFVVGFGLSLVLVAAWTSGFLAAQWAKLRARWPWLPG